MKGFTLIESLIVVTIIVTILVTVSIDYRIGEKNLSLNQSTAILSQNLRKAEEMAMSIKEFQGIIPRGGYGINLKIGDDFYTIFADCDEDHTYSIGNTCNGFPEIVEQVALGKKIKVADLFSGLSLSTMNIVFIPPNPIIVISGVSNEAVITLSLQDDANIFKTVKINKAGLIETF